MITLIKVFMESIVQALQQLTGNKLRSFLSLLGISIGIFCIIGVWSAVDSLENNVRGSFDKLGSDVIYVQKFSWSDSHQYWWKYIRRPQPSHDDFEAVAKKVKTADLISYYVVVGFRTLKFLSSSVERTIMIGVTYDFSTMFGLKFEKGRYFSQSEYHYGSNKAVIGYEVAQELFGPIDPIGKMIKVSGKKLEIIGVLEKAGDDIVSIMDFDEAILISYNSAKTFVNLNSKNIFESSINVKASELVTLDELKDEVTGILRSHRRLKPKQDDSFSLNELTMLTGLLDGFFSVLDMVGFFIGIFAILVGAFSVANIMFVSVKERTNLIGIKKALGAKKYIILLEFLIESIILCILGGLIGLLLVYLVTAGLSQVMPFPMELSPYNVFLGLSISIVVGIFSGVIPAFQAANMDPVDAIRSK